jgi:glucan-binding YG repeat protein
LHNTLEALAEREGSQSGRHHYDQREVSTMPAKKAPAKAPAKKAPAKKAPAKAPAKKAPAKKAPAKKK